MKSMKSLVIVLLLSAVSLLSGCASGPRYTPDTNAPRDKATVYIYRPSTFGAAITYPVSANGTELAVLPSHGYFVYYATPGETEFTAKTEAKTSVTLDTKAGETYYVKGSMGFGVLIGHPHLTQVTNDVGAKEIAGCKLVLPKKKAAKPT
jgi:hypothetical protein